MPSTPRTRQIQMHQQNPMNDRNSEIRCWSRHLLTCSDLVFGFFDDSEGLSPASFKSHEEGHQIVELLDQEKEYEEEKENNIEEENKFWKNQNELLQGVLYRTTSLELRIRSITKDTIKEMENAAIICGCGRQVAGDGGNSCRNCLAGEISGRLRNSGYNSAICKSKWRSSPGIPSGEHTFLDVIDSSKKGEVRVIIELDFRAEFEMAKASEEYNKLVHRLPEVFVGKVERLNNVVKIMCTAAKKCMKQKKMHLGPWRKHRYMQAKWLSPCERKLPTMRPENFPMEYSGQSRKPKASMLTVDLLDSMPAIRSTAVEVV